jgi:DNA-binding NarL/FixJ family response regulator
MSDKKIRVMLVDDHKVVRSGLRMVLDSQPGLLVVGEAGNGKEAVEMAPKVQPDVILLDLILGEDSGTDVIPELLKCCEETRVLILTASHDRDEHRRAVRQGAMGVLIKESGMELLIKAIQKVCEGEFWLDRFMTASLLTEIHKPSKPRKEDTAEDRLGRLSGREKEVIALVGEGLKNKQIADRLCISESTVRHHLTSIFAKLEVTDRLELLIFAYQNHLVCVPA